MQTEKQKAARAEATQTAHDHIVLSMRVFGHPLTAEGIADESGYPDHFIRIAIRRLLEENKIKLGPEDVEIGKTYVVA